MSKEDKFLMFVFIKCILNFKDKFHKFTDDDIMDIINNVERYYLKIGNDYETK